MANAGGAVVFTALSILLSLAAAVDPGAVVWSRTAPDWTASERFPFSWIQQGSTVTVFDERGTPTRHIQFRDLAAEYPGHVVSLVQGSFSEDRFAFRVLPSLDGVSEQERAAALAKGNVEEHLLITDGNGDVISRRTSHGASPSVLWGPDGRTVLFRNGRPGYNRPSQPELLDSRGNVAWTLPKAVYWDVREAPRAAGILTWSYPPDCCEDRLVVDVGGLPTAGTLTMRDWDGRELWSTSMRHSDRDPTEVVCDPSGTIVLRYGLGWRTEALRAISSADGRTLAERRVSTDMRLRGGLTGATWLVERSAYVNRAPLYLLNAATLNLVPVSYPEGLGSPAEVIGPIGHSETLLVAVLNGSIAETWYALRGDLAPVSLGQGQPRVAGRYLLWEDQGGHRVFDVDRLHGGPR